MSSMSDNVAGTLCYLGGIVTGCIFLFLAPYNKSPFVRFHAFQSIFLNIAFVLACFFVGALPRGLAFFVFVLMMLGGVVLWLFMMYIAFNDKKFKIPFIGNLAEKI